MTWINLIGVLMVYSGLVIITVNLQNQIDRKIENKSDFTNMTFKKLEGFVSKGGDTIEDVYILTAEPIKKDAKK